MLRPSPGAGPVLLDSLQASWRLSLSVWVRRSQPNQCLPGGPQLAQPNSKFHIPSQCMHVVHTPAVQFPIDIRAPHGSARVSQQCMNIGLSFTSAGIAGFLVHRRTALRKAGSPSEIKRAWPMAPQSAAAVHVSANSAPEPQAPDQARTLPDQDGAPDLEPVSALREPGDAVPDQGAAAASQQNIASASAEALAAGRSAPCKGVFQDRGDQSRCHGGLALGDGQTGSLGRGKATCMPDQALAGPSGGVSGLGTSTSESVCGQPSSALCSSASRVAGGHCFLGQAVNEGPGRSWQGGPARIGSRTSFVLCSESEGSSASGKRAQRSRSSVIFAGSSSTSAV